MHAADRDICFSPEFIWHDAVIVTTSDAVFCQETEHHDGIAQHFKSRQAYIKALAPSNALNAEKMVTHPLCWSSTKIGRVCRSTLMTEIYALSSGVEHDLRICATVVDMKGQLNIQRCEDTASASMGHDWLTDCKSLFSRLVLHHTKQVDNKRLVIVRYLIWSHRNDCDDHVTRNSDGHVSASSVHSFWVAETSSALPNF